ncbi:MAG: hypothetical protein KKE86_01950 [Planctomycetes bacterium]|nr:hypothetical protein [Planctomycetota bacterium]MBU4398078.1 hypothetical protein [Planctomycetota bacterium]
MSLAAVVAMATLTGLFTGASTTYVLGQIVLGLSVYVSLSFLADRPLVNPIQAFVAMFYWWFGVGPAVVATWSVLLGKFGAALDAQESGMEALWIVAPGLLLYAIVARWTLDWFSRTGIYARFLLPAGDNYRPKLLAVFLSLVALSMAAIALLQSMGIQGQEETSFFGGIKTSIWWVGVIAGVGSIAPLATSALMTALASPWRTISVVVKVLIVVVAAQTIMQALFGGWKSPIAILGASYVCAYVSRHQRPPWLIVIVGVLVFMLIITPFVGFGRHVALVAGAEDSAVRKEVFSDVLNDPEAFLSTEMESIDVSVFFRGIYPLAGELTRRNGFLDGEWHGDTIAWGFEILVPRAFNPDKRDSNIGNFFSRTVGVDIGVSGKNDFLNNIAISVPFEFVGNYGWGAGILSFGLIGVFWTLFVVWMLSPDRLSNHPLTPFLMISMLAMESALGHYLAGFRDLIIPLLLCYVIYRMFGGRI